MRVICNEAGFVTRSRLREKVKPLCRRLRGVAQVSRLAILYILSYGPREVWEFADVLGIADNLVSHHLKRLRQSGWIVKFKEGKRIAYRLNENAFGEFDRLFEDTPFKKSTRS